MKTAERFERASELVAGKVVERVVRQLPNVMSVEFSDGTGLYIDADGDWIEVSVSEIELQKRPDEESSGPPFSWFG